MHPVMNSFRPVRVLGSTIVLVAALVVLAYAIQDLWHYQQNLAWGYTEWARSGQGWWQLTSGIGETAAAVVLLTVGVRLLGSGKSPLRAEPA
jgi:hypothetical protein